MMIEIKLSRRPRHTKGCSAKEEEENLLKSALQGSGPGENSFCGAAFAFLIIKIRLTNLKTHYNFRRNARP
jgi:hypothetical protein